MTISIWRYSHLTLAISSFLFIIIASVTGIILGFEPISNQLKPYAIKTNEVTLSKTIASLKKEYDEVITLQVNHHNFVTASVITKEGKNETFYIDPNTGKKITNLVAKSPIYKWATNLHRSLFLKSTGRFLVGFFSFLLLLITLTGSILIIKRQGGILRFFSKVVNENYNQYYHVVLGRYTLIPILIITFTGVYLSLEKFDLLPKHKVTHSFDFSTISSDKKIPIEDFSIFKNIQLSEVKSIEFPFSDDIEDYFFVKLKSKELIVHQYTGDIISDQQLSWIQILTDYSLLLHTGRGSVVWSALLILACIAILFFIYSGFAITLARKRKNLLPKNKFKKDTANIIILVGSETGNTFASASSLFNALISSNQAVFITDANNYTTYDKATELIIVSATYGEGEPPINATKLLSLLKTVVQPNSINYTVVGFGSLAYPHYCKFAIDVDNALGSLANFTAKLPIYKINNQNFNDFKNWAIAWSTKTNIALHLKQKLYKPKKQQKFTVISKTGLNVDASFLIRIRPAKNLKFNAGDLIGITPKEDNIERLYSIGKVDNDILLSIKKHEFGICSNLLLNLNENESLLARIQKNKNFHFPQTTSHTVLIANGTGIAPYLGMLNTPNKTHLFWGGRTQESFNLYAPYLTKLNADNIHTAYSQENDKQYVQDIVFKEKDLIAAILKNNGTIMICGSIHMMNSVLKILEQITLMQLNTPLDTFQKNNKIKTDCY